MPFLLIIFVVWLVLDALAEWGALDAALYEECLMHSFFMTVQFESQYC